MKKIYLALDVGGTGIKGSFFSETGENLCQEIMEFDAKSKGTREEIFANLIEILDQLLDRAGEAEIVGMGMAFPGPFDYHKGISRIQGLGKYEEIYGLSIPWELRSRYKNARHADCLGEEIPMIFVHDVEAFALGECAWSKVLSQGNVMHICMGTGAGSAFTRKGEIVKNDDAVPVNGWIYDTPFRDGIIDEYLSARGLETLSRRIFGKEKSGRELAFLAGQGESRALYVFEEFGICLKEAAQIFLDSFQPDAVTLGGQIAKSFAYFGGSFLRECERRGISLHVTSDTSKSILKGLYMTVRQEKIAEETTTR